MLSAVTSLIFQKSMSKPRRSPVLLTFPPSHVGMRSPSNGACASRGRPSLRQGQALGRRSRLICSLRAHYVPPHVPAWAMSAAGEALVTFAPVRRILNEGRQWGGIEKRSHLSIMRLKEEKKKEDDFSSRVAFAACLGLIPLHFSSLLIKTKACMLRESVKKW